MISHTVLVRVTRPADPAVIAQVLDGLRAFAAAPPHALEPGVLREALVLRPDGPSSTEGALEVRFAGAEAFQAYLADPAHLALVADVLAPHCEWLSIQSED